MFGRAQTIFPRLLKSRRVVQMDLHNPCHQVLPLQHQERSQKGMSGGKDVMNCTIVLTHSLDYKERAAA